ncbi:MAG: T9SS type A sorting domain-containing protein [Bacteroidales bacterium]|nr:T9SS type A sorting domain-containing protein [Bacteroidales bacterium]
MKKKSYRDEFISWRIQSILIALFLVIFLPVFTSAQDAEISITGVETSDIDLQEDPEGMWEIIRNELNAEQRDGQGFPPIWDVPVNTGTIHGYIINLAANPRINEIPLQYGDYIGGFYLRNGERICGGARMWTGTENVICTLFGDDNTTTIKDGFSGGELIEFRFFLQETQKEYVVSIMSYYVATGYVTNGRWYPTSLSMVMNMKAVKAMDFYISTSENPICINNQVTLSANEFIGTGGPYTFLWSSNPPGFDHTVQNPPPVSLDVTTSFLLTVTDPVNTSVHQISVMVNDYPTASAGNDGEICANETFEVTGVSTNALNVQWSTSGDGTFANPSQASTVYTPGELDKNSGSVVLTFEAEPYSPCSVDESDDLTLSIYPLPSVIAGEDMSACGNETVILNATSTNYGLIQWTTSGSGTFSNPTSLTTQYIPSANDITNGVTLTICVNAISPCVYLVCDQLNISYLPGPTVASSSIIRRCEGQTFNLNGSASNNSGVLWTTQGDGTFANPNVIQTVYTPGPQDVANSGTVVTLNSLPIPPCDIPATKNVNLFIQQLPKVITFGPNTDFACKDSYLQLNAVAQEYTSVAWTRIGDGTFSASNILNPKYFPGPNDIANGSFTLILTLGPKQYCSVGTTENKTVQIIDNPTVGISTVSNQLVCAEPPFQVQGQANSYQSVLWSTAGDGSFGNQNALSTSYTPGPTDISSGSNIQLTLVAAPIAPCQVSAEDFIYVSFRQPPTANAGNNATICENQTYQLSGSAVSYSSVLWQSNGTGSFSNTAILQPVYTPSNQDAMNGGVILTLTSNPISPCAVSASDQMVLTIQRLSSANAGTDATICENQTHTLNGSALRYTSLLWTTSGTGTFSNTGVLNPVYTLSAADKLAGSLTLTLTSQPLSPCSVSASDQMTLNIKQLSTANAGADATICEDATYSLNGSAQRYSTLLWTTSGTGSFSNNGILNPVYTASTGDKLSGSVQLTLTSQPVSPCVVTATDQMTLTIQRLSTANAGSDATICENQTHTLNGSAQRYSSVLWTTSGTGTFSNSGILNPVYTPSAADKLAGSLTLTLTTQPLTPCAVAATDQKALTIQRLSTANAGLDATICEDATYLLDGQAERYSAVLWTSSGTGAFSNSAILNPVYTPSAADKLAGSLTLTLTSQPLSPCSVSASDQMVLSIQQLSTANAGTDATICENATYTLDGQAVRYSAVQWTSSGTGTFSNIGILNPVYTPSAADKLAGSLTLTLTSQPLSPCSVSASDQMTLNIQRLSTANAGLDAAICENQTYSLSGQAERYSAVLWTSSGTGTFSNSGILNPVYTPSAADKLSGSLTLTLTSQPLSPCSVSASDQMTLSIQRLSTANAGLDDVICENQTYSLSGQAERYSAVQWTSSGTGTFSNSGILNPVYTPSTGDKLSGSVQLTLTSQPVSPCAVSASDQMTLTIQRLSTANAGLDATICENQTHALNGAAQRYSTLVWTTSGTGSFSNSGILNPVYTPSVEDKLAGSLTLTLITQPISPCAVAASDHKVLTIQRLSTANAGLDATICEDATYLLDGQAERYSAVLWTSSGTGTFSNSSILNPIYTPSAADKLAGLLTLTLTSQPLSPCSVSASDQMTLNIQQLATANAGIDATICENQTHTLNGSAQRYSTLLWTTSGTGSFSNSGILSPIYTPSTGDKLAGAITLTMTAQPVSPCTVSTSDQVTLTIQRLSTANAGLDATICENQTFTLNAAAQRYSTLLWTTSGTGSFSNSGILNPVYTPSTGDKLAGAITLTLTAQPVSPCVVSASDQMTLTIQRLSTANAGLDATICENQTHTLNGAAQRYSTLLWTTSGTGTFSNSGILNPVYTPSAADKLAGSLTLTLTTQPLSPCAVSATDQKVLNIQRLSSANAGQDALFCGDEPYQLAGQAIHYSSVLWETSGSGTFSSNAILNPTYTPSQADQMAGFINLTLTAVPVSPCAISASDQMTLIIDILEVQNDLVINQEVYVGNALELSFEVLSYSAGNYSWFFNGTLIENATGSTFEILQITPADAGYYQSVFTNNCGTVSSNEALVEVLQTSTHQVILPEGWCGISSYVTPVNPAMEDIFSDILENLILISDNYGIYWPGQNINTLGDWSVTKGYKIKMETINLLNIEGNIRYPIATLSAPFGWSYLPVNSPCAVDVAEQFSANPSVCMIKDIAGTGIYWPEYGVNTLQELLPGKAYEIYNNSDIPFTVRYPMCESLPLEPGFKVGQSEIIHPWNKVHKTPSSHIFGFTNSAISVFEPGDLIGIFTQDNICAGVTQFDNHSEMNVLTAFITDHSESQITGFVEGELVSFKLFRPSTNQEFSLDVNYAAQSLNNGVFVSNGISLINKIELTTTSIDNDIPGGEDFSMEIFPNPTTGLVNVSFSSEKQMIGEVTILNATGQVILKGEIDHNDDLTVKSYDLTGHPAGVYYIRIVADKVLKNEKIILR